MSRADLDKDPHAVAAMFDGVARRYDLTNTVLTAGQDRRWRALARRALDLQPGEIVLDLAAGTAVSTVETPVPAARSSTRSPCAICRQARVCLRQRRSCPNDSTVFVRS